MPHTITLPVSPVLQITTLNNCLTANFHHPYYFRGEFHPFWEMVYAKEDCFCVAGGDKVYTMRKGDVIFHKPMEFHRLWSMDSKDVHAYIIGFCAEGGMLEQLEDRAFELNHRQQAQLEEIMHFASTAFPRIKRGGMNNHLVTMSENRNELSVQLQVFVDQFQLFLLSLAYDSSPLTAKEISDSEDTRLYQQIVRLLTEHTRDWITEKEISQQLCYSQSRIKRTFAMFSDVGIHKYLLKLKTAEAIRLLHDGLPCSEISRLLGFSNQNYFSTVFKRETGTAPSRYADTM